MLPIFYAKHVRWQNSKPTKRRAPPPPLASLDKLNPYTNSLESGRSSPSSSYLTPPITNVPSSTPPPQPVAEDYLNARTAHRKRRTRTARRAQASFQESMGSMSAQHGRFASSDIDSGDARSNSSQPNSLAGKKPALDTSESFMKHQSSTLSAPAAAHLVVKGDLAVPPPNTTGLGTGTTASNALRRTSQVAKESSLFGSRHLRRLSQAIVAAVQYPADSHSEEGDKIPEAVSGISRIQTADVDATSIRDELRHRKTGLQKSTQLDLETPATITLRKASDAYFVMIGQTTADGGTSATTSLAYAPEPQADRKPSVALMNFRSQRLADVRKSLWYSLPLLSNQDERVESTEEDPERSTSTMNKAVHESLSIFESLQSPSTVVEPAITFTDVHTAPQTFASVPDPIKEYWSTLPKVRRTSRIQIKSRTCVHEIIWREDGSSSDSSSQGSVNPIPNDKVPQTLGTLNPTAPKAIIASHSAPPTPRWHLENPTLEALPEENLFEWSWKDQQAMVPSREPSPVHPPASALVSHGTPTTPPKAPVSHSAPTTPPRRRSISKESRNSSVESFPPLMDRKNTTEWRVAPLVDLDDPMAGRVTRMWLPQITAEGVAGLKSVSENSLGREEAERRQCMDGESGEEVGRVFARRASAHPYAIPRLGPSGRMGSSIGASSHKKMVCFV